MEAQTQVEADFSFGCWHPYARAREAARAVTCSTAVTTNRSQARKAVVDTLASPSRSDEEERETTILSR